MQAVARLRCRGSQRLPADKLSPWAPQGVSASRFLPPAPFRAAPPPDVPSVPIGHCSVHLADTAPFTWRSCAACTNLPDITFASCHGTNLRFPAFLRLRPSSGNASPACRRLRQPFSPGRLSVSVQGNLRLPQPCCRRARPFVRSTPWFPARMGEPMQMQGAASHPSSGSKCSDDGRLLNSSQFCQIMPWPAQSTCLCMNVPVQRVVFSTDDMWLAYLQVQTSDPE